MIQPCQKYDDDCHTLPNFEMVKEYHQYLDSEVAKYPCISEKQEEYRLHIKKLLEDASKNHSLMKKYTNECHDLMNKLRDVYCGMCTHDWERHTEYHNERYYTCKKCGLEQ